LRIIPLGGVGEIGKNMTVVEYDGRLIVVDCGLSFPGADLVGVDLVLPDFSYLKDRADDIEAIVLTHGHEDHIGALPWVIRELGETTVPAVVGGELTIAMAKSKLDEHRLRQTNLQTLTPGKSIEYGPFGIETIHLTHSIPDARAVVISCDLGRVLFTGDYKFDQTPIGGDKPDFARLAQLGSEGVLLMCADSTYADRPGWSASEALVGPSLHDVFRRCEGRIIVTCFASNIHRVDQVLRAAADLGRKVALVGRSMRKNVSIGRSLGYVEFPDDVVIQPRALDDFPDERVVIMSTGSQGEAFSALRRMAHGAHAQIELRAGDTVVFSATPIPGNEGAVNETINRLYHIGCNVITSRDAPIHVSGHGHAEELKLMINLVRPQYIMPVHGTFRLMRLHGEMAVATGMDPAAVFAENANGLPLEIDEQGAYYGNKEHAGVVFVDGLDVGDVHDIALRDRRGLSEDGIIMAMIAVSGQDGALAAEPEVLFRGVPFLDSQPDLMMEVTEVIRAALKAADYGSLVETGALSSELHEQLSELLYRSLKRRPMIVPVVVEV
jgi:ribonuclease J